MTAIIKFAFLRSLRDRGSFYGPLLLIATLYVVELSFWSFTSSRAVIAGYPGSSVLTYAAWSIVCYQLTTVSPAVDNIVSDIETGAIEQLLIRPVSPFAYFMLDQIGLTLARLLVYSPVFACLALYFSVPISVGIFHFAVAVMLGSVINAFLGIFLSSLAFKFTDAYAFIAMKDTMMWMVSGALIPLDLYPSSISSLFSYLPFSYAAYIPAKLVSGGLPNGGWVLIEAVLIALYMFVFCVLAWRWGLKSYQGYGNPS